jgi:hypothetical protein
MVAKITLGTRGSELARAQTLLVEKAIRTEHPNVGIETKIIVTRGDDAKVIDLHAGRKGLFTAEIERALIAGEVDIAVHSAKDLPSETSLGAQIAAVLPRAPVNDVLISKHSVIWLLFPMARHWVRAAYEGNVSCIGNAQTSASLISAATYLPVCGNSPRMSGTALC